MHDYSIDKHPKEKIIFILAFCAIWLAPHLNHWVGSAVESLAAWRGFQSPAATAIPMFGLFLVLYFLFERVLWRIRWLRKLLLVPDLNGTWKCSGKTVLKEGKEATIAWEGTLMISQSWSKISIALSTTQSRSKSISASVFHETGLGYRLFYQYSNDPAAGQADLQRHYGHVDLLFEEGERRAVGSYFTDQHRQTVGVMELTKESTSAATD